MNHLGKIAMASLLSLSAAFVASEAKADERDGTIERFVCVRVGNDTNALRANYVQLNGKNAGMGFGGGNWALKLINDGATTGGRFNYAGGAANFTRQKRESKFQIYFKPVDVSLNNLSLDICFDTSRGGNGLRGQFASFPTRAVGNGWYVLEEDLDTYNNEFPNAIINRISVRLDSNGDNGHVLLGNMRVISVKDVIDPSTLIMDKQPCGNIETICGGN